MSRSMLFEHMIIYRPWSTVLFVFGFYCSLPAGAQASWNTSGENVSFKRWAEELYGPSPESEYCPGKGSCENRCDGDDRLHGAACYCDKYCEVFGDCCYDYFKWCQERTYEKGVKEVEVRCFELSRSSRYGGIIQVSSCPRNIADRVIQQQCNSDSTTDRLRMVPVHDYATSVTYKNIFCATCNNARNMSFWSLEPTCSDKSFCRDQATEKLLECYTTNCSFKYEPPIDAITKKCFPRKGSCSNDSYYDSEKRISLKELCSLYLLNTHHISIMFNLHCSLCNGRNFSCLTSESGPDPGSPQLLGVLFRFGWSGYSVNFENRQEVLIKVKKCPVFHVYDFFLKSCRRVVPITINITMNGTNSRNCTAVFLEVREFTLFENKTLFVKSNKKIYGKNDYVMFKHGVYLCSNFSREYEVSILKRTPNRILEVFTYAGCGVSITALLFLLFTYGMFPELRNVSGKNLMNLASALILYQAFLLAASETKTRGVCVAVATGLHYLILTSFAWMAVIGFDVSRTFTARGKRVYGSQTLLKYCLFAWGTPLVVVVGGLALDLTNAVTFGYGVNKALCWIENGAAAFVTFGVPAALVLVYNFVSLMRTIVATKKNRKVTSHSSRGSLALVYLKLMIVFGLTWVLGFAATASEKLTVLWYPYVILNSLQGLFISVSFVAKKNVISLFRARLSKDSDRVMDTTQETTRRTRLNAC